jgi:2-iminobutanoate/2-iminopropanoate deaminase
MPHQHILLPDNPGLPFSDAVLAGDTLYISGRLGLDPKTGHAPADLNEELQLLLDGFDRVLAAAGMSRTDLVSVTVFCPDLSLFNQFNAAYRTRFTGDFPARAFIGSGPLLLGAHYEMVGIAVRERSA